MSRLENNVGVESLFFDLASESRLGILCLLGKESLKMNDIARKLDLTSTEAFRQLQRLSEARLVQRQPDGLYSLTPYATLELNLSSSLGFVYRNRDYFSEHDVSCLPYEFVNRLGELSAGEFYGETLATMNRARKMVNEAENYVWAIAEQSESSHTPIVNQKVPQGLKIRFLMQKELAKTIEYDPQLEHLKERKYMERIPLTLLITEKESAVHFRKHTGKMEFIGFFGTDDMFHKWTRDLFVHYWEKSERWYPGIQIK